MSSKSRFTVVAAMAFASVLTACVHPSAAQAPHLWQLRGAVIAVQDSTVRVQHKTGQVVTLTLDHDTAYSMRKEPASRDQVRVGSRVMVDVLRTGGVDRAVLVRVF